MPSSVATSKATTARDAVSSSSSSSSSDSSCSSPRPSTGHFVRSNNSSQGANSKPRELYQFPKSSNVISFWSSARAQTSSASEAASLLIAWLMSVASVAKAIDARPL